VVKLFLHLLCIKLAAKFIKGINTGAFAQEYSLKLIVTSCDIFEYSLKLLVTSCDIFDLGIYSYDIFGLGIILVTLETQCAFTLVSSLSSGFQSLSNVHKVRRE
jgi:hypothetical protein